MKTLSPEAEKIRNVLINVAKHKSIISYSELCVVAKLPYDMANNPNDRCILGGILGDISEYEYENGRPMLSAVCRTWDRIGGGFFEMASIALYGDNSKMKELKDNMFDMEELNKTHEFWSKCKF